MRRPFFVLSFDAIEKTVVQDDVRVVSFLTVICLVSWSHISVIHVNFILVM